MIKIGIISHGRIIGSKIEKILDLKSSESYDVCNFQGQKINLIKREKIEKAKSTLLEFCKEQIENGFDIECNIHRKGCREDDSDQPYLIFDQFPTMSLKEFLSKISEFKKEAKNTELKIFLDLKDTALNLQIVEILKNSPEKENVVCINAPDDKFYDEKFGFSSKNLSFNVNDERHFGIKLPNMESKDFVNLIGYEEEWIKEEHIRYYLEKEKKKVIVVDLNLFKKGMNNEDEIREIMVRKYSFIKDLEGEIYFMTDFPGVVNSWKDFLICKSSNSCEGLTIR